MKKVLGKGLGALIFSANSEESGVREVKVNEVEPNIDQPRKNFDDDKILLLSESIKMHGIVQPIIVRRDGEIFRIVAGERRWRAARLAGLDTVPVVIKDITNRQVMEISLIENLQREDLNAIEEAEAFSKLMKEFKMTQEEISDVAGKSRPAIANSIRLLLLDNVVKGYVVSGEISSGHARAILAIENREAQRKFAKEIISKGLNVRDAEKLVKNLKANKGKIPKLKKKNENLIEIEDKLKNLFGTKVQLVTNNKMGKIVIEYYSNEELERILELFDSMK